jgi:hypothetical protein
MTVIDQIIEIYEMYEMPVIFKIAILIFLIFKVMKWFFHWFIYGTTSCVRVDEAEQMRNSRTDTLLLTIKMQHEAKMNEIKRQHELKRREHR